MADELLSTRAAASLLGVGTTSVKRWADAGLLSCVKTPGGHRRFPRDAVVALVRAGGPAAPDEVEADGWAAAWVERLTLGVRGSDVARALFADRERRGSWWAVCDDLGAVLDEIGRLWACGEVSVLQEHIASERLARGLARVSESIPVARDAPQGLLMMVPGDDHTLGLSLLELCLREAGWRARWAGRHTPVEGAVRFIESGQVRMVAVSASQFSTDERVLLSVADQLAKACRESDVRLLLGGRGSWPDPPLHGARLRRFEDVHALLVGEEPQHGRRVEES